MSQPRKTTMPSLSERRRIAYLRQPCADSASIYFRAMNELETNAQGESNSTQTPGAEAAGGFLQAGTRRLRLGAPNLKGVVAEYVVTDHSETATTDDNTSASKRARLTRDQDANSNVSLAGTLFVFLDFFSSAK